MLKEYRDNFIRGRPLDVEREDTPCEGKVIEIFVSRMNIFKDAMAELITDPPIADLSFPLDVTFIGEEAADYGGPRKEFLGAVMREIHDQLFDEAGSGEYILTNDVTSLRQNYYFGAGLIFGKYVIPNYDKGELSLHCYLGKRKGNLYDVFCLKPARI